MRRPPTHGDLQSVPGYDASMSGENDNNLISFIATTVEALRARVDTISEQMVTKVEFADLKDGFADLRSEFGDLKDRMAKVESRMATKEELAKLEKRVAAVEDQMATKDDLSLFGTVVRGNFEQVHFRFDTLERVMSTRFGQVETDISSLRSVVYLLVKANPICCDC